MINFKLVSKKHFLIHKIIFIIKMLIYGTYNLGKIMPTTASVQNPKVTEGHLKKKLLSSHKQLC